MRSIENAEYIIVVGDGATALCEKHRDHFVHIMAAAGQEPIVGIIDPDEDAIACQACHLAAVRDVEGMIQ